MCILIFIPRDHSITSRSEGMITMVDIAQIAQLKPMVWDIVLLLATIPGTMDFPNTFEGNFSFNHWELWKSEKDLFPQVDFESRSWSLDLSASFITWCFRITVWLVWFPMIKLSVGGNYSSSYSYNYWLNAMWIWLQIYPKFPTKGPRQGESNYKADSLQAKPLVTPRNDVLCFLFWFALNAMDRLPTVFWNTELLGIVPFPWGTLICWRFLNECRRFTLLSVFWILWHDRKDERDADEERRTKPQRILLNSSFILISSSIRRCWVNSWTSP